MGRKSVGQKLNEVATNKIKTIVFLLALILHELIFCKFTAIDLEMATIQAINTQCNKFPRNVSNRKSFLRR